MGLNTTEVFWNSIILKSGIERQNEVYKKLEEINGEFFTKEFLLTDNMFNMRPFLCTGVSNFTCIWEGVTKILYDPNTWDSWNFCLEHFVWTLEPNLSDAEVNTVFSVVRSAIHLSLPLTMSVKSFLEFVFHTVNTLKGVYDVQL